MSFVVPVRTKIVAARSPSETAESTDRGMLNVVHGGAMGISPADRVVEERDEILCANTLTVPPVPHDGPVGRGWYILPSLEESTRNPEGMSLVAIRTVGFKDVFVTTTPAGFPILLANVVPVAMTPPRAVLAPKSDGRNTRVSGSPAFGSQSVPVDVRVMSPSTAVSRKNSTTLLVVIVVILLL